MITLSKFGVDLIFAVDPMFAVGDIGIL